MSDTSKLKCLHWYLCNFQDEESKGKAAVFQPNILMCGRSPSDYVLRALSEVHTNDLEQTLLVSGGFLVVLRVNPILIFFGPGTLNIYNYIPYLLQVGKDSISHEV